MKTSLNEEKLCKICYEGTSSPDNPLLNLCKCQGSLRYSHWGCLSEWMANKYKILDRTPGVFVKIDSKEFRCEICGASLNFAPLCNGKSFFLFDFLKDFREFLVLRFDNVFLFQNLGEKGSVEIGRAINSDYKLDDSTVSRQHCRIFKAKNSIMIEDLGSKFGTLIKMRKSFLIESKNPYVLQRNNTVFSIKRKERKTRVLDFCLCGCT